MYKTSNDLAPTTRRSVVKMLNEQLAGVIDLQLQAKQAHWNVKGPNFSGLHDLFEEIAGQAAEYADMIAERAAALGGVARGTLQAVSAQSHLPEYPLEAGEWRAHVRAMQDALATFGRGVRGAIDEVTALNDADTADLFTEVSRGTDKSLWKVEAHIQDAPVEEKQVDKPAAGRGRDHEVRGRDHEVTVGSTARGSPRMSR